MKRSKAMSTKIVRSLRAKVKMTTTIRLKKMMMMMTGELRIKYLLAKRVTGKIKNPHILKEEGVAATE